MAAGIIKALFGFGKMKTVPWTQMTPELHNQLSSQLGKLMFVVKSQNLKLTKFQQDYLMNQLKHMDEFEKRVLSPRVTKDTSVDDLLKGPHRDERGRVWDFGTKDRPFPGFTPKIVPKETDAQIKARMIKENRRNVQKSYLRQLDEKILKVEEGFLTKADLDNMSPDALDSLRRNVDPHGMHKHFGSEEIGKIDDFASGGRIGFAAGGAIIKELVKRIYAVKAGTGIYKGLSETNKTQLIKKFISELEAAPGGKKYLDNLWTKKIKKLEKEDRLKEIEQKSAAQSLAIKNYPEGPSTLPWSKEQEMHWKRLMGEDIKEELVDTDYIIDQADELLRKKASGGIAGELRLNDGGRAGFKEGSGMKRRTFLKMLGGLGALPIVGKYFKLAKPAATVASKTPMVAQSPEFLGTLIEVLRAKGIEKITKLGNKITEYKGVVLEEQPGRIEVYRKGKKKEGYHEVLEGTEEVKDEGLETAKIIQGEDEYFGKVSKKGDEDLIEIADEIKGMVPDADEWIQPVRFTKSINPRLQAHHDYWDDIDKKAKTMKDYASGGLVDLLSL
jgi:hypothetical protein